MINIPLIGVAAALVLCAVVAKFLMGGQEKASKADKAQIMKQLLAKSEGEIPIPTKTPAARSRVPAMNQSKPPVKITAAKPQQAVPAIRSK